MEELFKKFERSQNPAYLPSKSLLELFNTDYHLETAVVDNLLYNKSIYLLCGSAKVGKSFAAAQIAYCVSTGTPLWGHKTHPGTVLVLSLEDNDQRITSRLFRMYGYNENTTLRFSTHCKPLNGGLESQIEFFINEYPKTTLIIIDTFQKIRDTEGREYSYASDYKDITILKQLAAKFQIAILLVHHTRKSTAEDRFDMILGTNGLFGAVDGAFILNKPDRNEPYAYLDVTGRDISSRQLYLYYNPETLIWELVSNDNIIQRPPNPILEAISIIVTPENPKWSGTATELLQITQIEMNANTLSTHLNLHKSELFSDYNILFERTRTCTGRHITLTYVSTE